MTVYHKTIHKYKKGNLIGGSNTKYKRHWEEFSVFTRLRHSTSKQMSVFLLEEKEIDMKHKFIYVKHTLPPKAAMIL